MVWVWWLMVDLAYLIFDPVNQLVVEYSYFECFLMVWSLLDPFGLSLAPQNPTNRFTHLSLRGTLFTLRRFVIFYHSRGIIFIGILCYDSYYVKNHPPKYFQVHIFLFDWVLGVVTFQLPLDFHPIFSYPKPHGLTWDQGGHLSLCIMNLCFKFHLNPLRQSKVIGLPSGVPNLGINGG